jgi:hypothetical protein
MPVTQEEFDQIVKATCPQCASGRAVRFRDDTQEFVHDMTVSTGYSHTFCLATGVRKVLKVDNGAS